MTEKLCRLRSDGVISDEELRQFGVVPSDERLRSGPVAVIECIEEIPCNPCEAVCHKKAITIGTPITNLPKLDEKACVGCGLCIPKCPGLAIFMEDHTFSETHALVYFPYEFLPLPRVGDVCEGVDRAGRETGEVEVVKVLSDNRQDATAVIAVKVKRELAGKVRGIRRLATA